METEAEKKQFKAKGLEMFFRLSGWLIGPIILALLAGNFLDSKYNAKPWLLLSCLGIAFLITCFGIVKEAMDFMKSIEKKK